MIGYLSGKLIYREANGTVTIEVGGVGYRVLMKTSSFAQCQSSDASVQVWTHTYVKEDALSLYGFETIEERDCFEVLIQAHGVGPALALGILSVHSVQDLSSAVAQRDLTALMQVPGVGRKTAERLVIELESRLEGIVAPLNATLSIDFGKMGEVRQALLGLGFSGEEIKAVVGELLPSDSTQDMIKKALSRLKRVS